ncbi:heterokaryon incompatibility protein-domain-containing protein [Dactylonectria macrodidyma]|uniref:Heterokaryon incompatibility protein-domain-containing protein n=1 Tax=Dactylonectria macrodidyma TaxID=307937 RepID=A0A9P9FH85_9HYPO|nr:heterokaryon incompatibility protein-domain-containing protein [Dactylonectria macrodidyma]
MDTVSGIYPAYASLKDGQIRLLRLNPTADSSSPVRCNFIVVSMANKPCYEALSYVWGETSHPKTIRMEDVVVTVTNNLFLALSNLRRQDKDRVLWVDALCINQEDINERSRQVSLMGSIYKEAQSVAVYLGQKWDGHDIAFDYLELAAEQSDYHFSPSLTPRLEVRGNDASSTIMRENLIRFFESQWFRRVWTVQEYVLARRATFQYGSTLIESQRVQDAFSNLRNHAAMDCCGRHASILEECPVYGTNLFFALSRIDDLDSMRRYRNQNDVLETLSMYRQRGCSDPRDRVYGILGMDFRGYGSQIRPDYSIEVKELFVQLAQEQIQQTQSLDVLTHVLRGEDSVPGLPSYVPDWNISLTPITLFRCKGRALMLMYYNASAGVAAEFKLTLASQATSKGIIVDEIKTVGMITSFSKIEDAARTKAIVDEARSLSGLPSRLPVSFQEANAEEIAFWQTLCGNLSTHMHNGVGVYEFADPPVDYERYLRWSRLVESHASHELDLPTADVEVFGNTLLPNIAARRFMRTRTGLMGFVPAESLPGDPVVVLAGGKVPYVLRKQPNTDNSNSDVAYSFLGDAYVTGLMNGEAIQKGPIWTSLNLV